MDNQNTDTMFIPSFVARQPIFDTKQNVWGYELLHRYANDTTAELFSDEDSATLALTVCSSTEDQSESPAENILLNFSQQSVINKAPETLPPDGAIIEVGEEPASIPGFVDTLKQLKSRGYRIALNNYEGREGCEGLAEVADIIKINMLGRTLEDLSPIMSKAKSLNRDLIAEGVEDHVGFELAKSLGFPLFQGLFFRQPVFEAGRKLSANEASRLQLFQMMEQEEPDFSKLTETIEADVAISYSLLAYLNSPAFGLKTEITSIKQALILLGWKQIKNWLRVVILRDMTPDDKTTELPYLAVQRGKFFQLALSAHNLETISPDSVFLFGLFSLLDTMLSMPMESIVAELPLKSELKAALCGGENEYTTWLKLARGFENAQWELLDELVKTHNLDPVNTAQAYYNSISWASVFFQRSGSS